MKKQYKVGVKHFINTNLKPVKSVLHNLPTGSKQTHELVNYYSIWYNVSYKRYNTTLKSIIETPAYDINALEQKDIDMLELESKAIKKTIQYFAKRHDDFTIKGQKELLSFYSQPFNLRVEKYIKFHLLNNTLSFLKDRFLVDKNNLGKFIRSIISCSENDPEFVIDILLKQFISNEDYLKYIENDSRYNYIKALKEFCNTNSINSRSFSKISIADWILEEEKNKSLEDEFTTYLKSINPKLSRIIATFIPEVELTSFGPYWPD